MMATIFSLAFMQAVNWIAPDTPQVMISLGRTVRPDRPICRRLDSQPFSTSGRVTASAPPRASANSRIRFRSAWLRRPRPPTTRISASEMLAALGMGVVETWRTGEAATDLGVLRAVIAPEGASVRSAVDMTL